MDGEGSVQQSSGAEHLTAVDPTNGNVNPEVREWREKRNILGLCDGRPIEILPPHAEGAGASVPDKYWFYGGIEFLASRSAGLTVILEKSAVPVDIRLEIGGGDGRLPVANIPAQP